MELMDTTGVSIIIPMHNAQRFLHECLDSLLESVPAQSEIIIIDDGSTDQSVDICREYIALHQGWDIQLVSQENQGVSAARNKGISLATRPYIGFLDSDDVCTPHMHQRLLETALSAPGGADLCYCGFTCYNQDMSAPVKALVYNNFVSGTGFDVFLPFVRDKMYFGISTYLVKRSLVEEHGLRFTVGCKYGEDDEFTLKCLLHAAHVLVVPESLFRYRISQYSVTSNLSLHRFDSTHAAIRLRDYVRQHFPQSVAFLRALSTIYIPSCILNSFYLFAQDGQPLRPVMRYIKDNDLDQCLKGARATTASGALKIALWHVSPWLLYTSIYAKRAMTRSQHEKAKK